MSNSEERGDKVDAEELETLFSLKEDKLYNRFIFHICHSDLCIICFRKHFDGVFTNQQDQLFSNQSVDWVHQVGMAGETLKPTNQSQQRH